MDKLSITPNEAAEAIATSPNNIYPLLKAGVIPATQMFGGNWKIDRKSFEEWFADMCKKESEERRLKCQIEQKE